MRQEVVHGLCENEGCHQVGKLNRFQGKYLCPSCLNPQYTPQDSTTYLAQREDAYTYDNVPLPGLKYKDIVDVQRGVDRFNIHYVHRQKFHG